ncbi:hypothetical protein GCM10010289_04260 [Streptomyces violascens]|uniref:Secreted protein n=1 Tax=Streptomyces violascens TaxID=67381 RepID=A0ABQ3QFQ6_9ACTN|nr:hypothetical protein GCM10010289_04260 [Streptomyces violascens]GHI36092.1 hypothetical protein Sviol_05000 [Streptomyces violascens]
MYSATVAVSSAAATGSAGSPVPLTGPAPPALRAPNLNLEVIPDSLVGPNRYLRRTDGFCAPVVQPAHHRAAYH